MISADQYNTERAELYMDERTTIKLSGVTAGKDDGSQQEMTVAFELDTHRGEGSSIELIETVRVPSMDFNAAVKDARNQLAANLQRLANLIALAD